MALVVTVTANPLLDHLAAAAVTAGRTLRIDGFRRIAGGKGLNMARVLARHGHRVAACAPAGGAAGGQLAALVAADGVEPVLTPCAAGTRIGFLALDPTGRATALMERGGPLAADEQAALVAAVAARLPGCALVLVGGAPPPGCDGLYRRLLDLCAAAGVPCWVDAYGPAMAAALAGPHPPALAKPNREERADGAAWERAGELHLSDGGAPLEVRRGGRRWRVVPPPVAEVNPVGSGDCYVAALAHARLAGWDDERAWRYAAAAGAANAARPGVADIAPADIAALASAARVTALD